jgi:hypothetical protein
VVLGQGSRHRFDNAILPGTNNSACGHSGILTLVCSRCTHFCTQPRHPQYAKERRAGTGTCMSGRTLSAKRLSSAVPTLCLISSSSGSSDCTGQHRHGVSACIVSVTRRLRLYIYGFMVLQSCSLRGGSSRGAWLDSRPPAGRKDEAKAGLLPFRSP